MRVITGDACTFAPYYQTLSIKCQILQQKLKGLFSENFVKFMFIVQSWKKVGFYDVSNTVLWGYCYIKNNPVYTLNSSYYEKKTFFKINRDNIESIFHSNTSLLRKSYLKKIRCSFYITRQCVLIFIIVLTIEFVHIYTGHYIVITLIIM